MPDSFTDIDTVVAPKKRHRFLWLKIPLALILACVAFEVLFLAWYWFVPPWGEMREGKIPASALIEDYQSQLADGDKKLPPLKWKPIIKSVPKSVSKVFILAEDSRFYEHDGFDYEAIAKAMDYNWKKKKIVRGASTISQQTSKNLFLSLSRNPLRKWHEVLLTYMLEAKLTKPQILHAYLNVAEFGTGIYGIEAAAQAYFKRSASGLSQEQAAQLAATLPSPKKHNPKSLTRAFQQRNRRVSSAIRMVDQYALGKKATGAASALPTSAELAERLREVMADPQGSLDDGDSPAADGVSPFVGGAPAADAESVSPAADDGSELPVDESVFPSETPVPSEAPSDGSSAEPVTPVDAEGE
ncbi:MAG: monofunctional biosynthetic peptidoglycan transglycosylase [Proteobacteria bacterium]|nr:MAG: monofunctional biosynthetic peptidoglycan transglycosylase [Pseudomonadota bacterium]